MSEVLKNKSPSSNEPVGCEEPTLYLSAKLFTPAILVATRNYMLAGAITVADTYTWDVAGTGTLTII